MTTPKNTIKTRLKTILQSERTIEFLNDLTNFGLSLGNPQLNNKFIRKVFQGNNIREIISILKINITEKNLLTI